MQQPTLWDKVVKLPPKAVFKERPYQQEAREAVQEAFKTMDSCIIELATGLGKTEIFTQIMDQWTDGRCLVIAPQITLVAQAASKVELRTGERPGIEQASLWSDETPWGRSKFVVASKDTLVRGRYERIRDVGLVVVDECHLSITESWAKLLMHFMEDGAKVIGVTATAKRHDKRSMRNVYQGCAYQYGIVDAIKDGWLVSAETKCIRIESLDLSMVGSTNTTMGRDFIQKELNHQLEDLETVYEISSVVARETRDKKTAIYCASVEEARLVAERLKDSYGINASWICSDTSRCPAEQRRSALESFAKDPKGISHLCNVGILTTGWDFPALEAIVMARPTKSKPLYTQIFGRGTRPLAGIVDFEGSTPESRRAAIAASAKPKFLMIDLVDATMAHKIVTSPDVMAGEWGMEVTERVKEKLLENEAAAELDEVMLDAVRELSDEKERKEREKRKRIAAEALYSYQDVDPFYGRVGAIKKRPKKEAGARFPFGRFRGILVKNVDTWYLKSAIYNNKPRLTVGWLRGAVLKELKRRGEYVE